MTAQIELPPGFGTWEQIVPGLLRIFTACGATQRPDPQTGQFTRLYPKWEAAWKDRRGSGDFIHPVLGFGLFLKITSVAEIGWDDWTYDLLDTGLVVASDPTHQYDVYETQSGIRTITLQAQYWSTEEMDTLNGMLLMSRLKLKLDSDAARQQLLAINVDYTDVGPSRDMATTWNGRRWSITSADFTLNCAVVMTDTDPVGYIDRVIMTSHVQAGEQDVTSSLQQNNETLPPEE